MENEAPNFYIKEWKKEENAKHELWRETKLADIMQVKEECVKMTKKGIQKQEEEKKKQEKEEI